MHPASLVSLCCAACTKLLESDSTLVLISLIAHTQRSALSDAALITNDSDGGFFCPSVTSTSGGEYTPWWVFSPIGHCSSFPQFCFVIFEPVFQRSDFFPITKWVHEAASAFCVEMMHSLIHGTYLNPLFPCGRYKLQSMLEIKHLFFCTFQPVKITGKFYRQATAQCSHQEMLRSHFLTNNQGFGTFSNTLSFKDGVPTWQVNI